jgi:hypothetical protein
VSRSRGGGVQRGHWTGTSTASLTGVLDMELDRELNGDCRTMQSVGRQH